MAINRDPDPFHLIERILVKWLGYPDYYNQWINENEVINLARSVFKSRFPVIHHLNIILKIHSTFKLQNNIQHSEIMRLVWLKCLIHKIGYIKKTELLLLKLIERLIRLKTSFKIMIHLNH